jgi:PII-like signaling protein
MKTEGEGLRLRIFVGESDRWEGRPLYECIIRTARERGLAGATALRGIEGFGANDRIHTVKVLRLSEDLPIVIEIVDRQDRIAAFLPTIDNMIGEGTVTLEKVHVMTYRRDAEAEQADDEIPLETSENDSPVDSQAVFTESADLPHPILENAKQAAASSKRVFIDSVDVLLAMLRESGGIAARVLGDLRIDVRTVAGCLRDEVSRDEPSAAYQSALEAKSQAAARWLEHDNVGTEHLLLALCEIRPSAATDILMRLGTQPRDICKDVLKILGHQEDWQRWLADHPDM